MIELSFLLFCYVVDWLLKFMGTGGYLLVFLPPVLFFVRKPSTVFLLLMTFLSGLLAEAMHGYYAGTLLVGMGCVLFAFQYSARTVDWRSFPVQILSLLFYAVVVFFIRTLLVFIWGNKFYFPDPGGFFISSFLAIILLAIFNSRTCARRRY